MKAKRNRTDSPEIEVDSVRAVVIELGSKLFGKLNLDSLIMEAARKGETSAIIDIGQTISREEACPLAMFLQSRGFLVTDFRTDSKKPRIIVHWY
jgi:hypothetical protein